MESIARLLTLCRGLEPLKQIKEQECSTCSLAGVEIFKRAKIQEKRCEEDGVVLVAVDLSLRGTQTLRI